MAIHALPCLLIAAMSNAPSAPRNARWFAADSTASNWSRNGPTRAPVDPGTIASASGLERLRLMVVEERRRGGRDRRSLLRLFDRVGIRQVLVHRMLRVSRRWQRERGADAAKECLQRDAPRHAVGDRVERDRLRRVGIGTHEAKSSSGHARKARHAGCLAFDDRLAPLAVGWSAHPDPRPGPLPPPQWEPGEATPIPTPVVPSHPAVARTRMKMKRAPRTDLQDVIAVTP